MMNFKI